MEDKDNGLAILYRAADAVQGFLETGLVPVIYETFWKSMPDPIQASCYLTVLITKWLALETADPMPLPDLVKKVAAKEFENPSDQAKLLGEDSGNSASLAKRESQTITHQPTLRTAQHDSYDRLFYCPLLSF